MSVMSTISILDSLNNVIVSFFLPKFYTPCSDVLYVRENFVNFYKV